MRGNLILEDGTFFNGYFFGYPKMVSGEVVFTTGMVGYPQSLTDPSYWGQILVFTFPLMGNYGIPKMRFTKGLSQNFESGTIQVKGVIVSSHTEFPSHWQSIQSLDGWLKQNKIPGLFGIDTRAVTQKLREKGTMLGIISADKLRSSRYEFKDPNLKNLVKEVSCDKVIIHGKGGKRILLIDCGSKASIIRSFLELKTTIIQAPWNFDPLENKLSFDGVIISNGPGDPKKVKATIKIIQKLLGKKIPVLGICLGHQILSLAIGAKTYKLKYGHRSVNQPCLLKGTNQAYITSQNHGYSVKSSSLPRGWREWFVNLNDQTCEGVIHQRKPWMGVQFHPEANPGPADTSFIFEKFLSWIK